MNCPFRKFKEIFGREGEGVHSIRIFNIAIVDVLLTILGGLLISCYMKINFWIIFLFLIMIGIILHRLFCVNTTINKMIFGEI